MTNTKSKPMSKTPKTPKYDHQPESLVVSNDDILTEILIRLPVTSILRFKSVSKHWRSLLTHTHFTRRYDNFLKSPGLYFSSNYSTLYVPFNVENPSPPPFRSLDIYINRPQVKIVQSCNGLLLCSTDRGPQGDRGALKHYVFNPTTKQLAIIPPITNGSNSSDNILAMGLAFHQTDCVHFKLVCFRRLKYILVRGFPRKYRWKTLIHIYSSVTRKWKIVNESSFTNSLRDPVYWNGFVYWAPLYLNRNLFCFNVDVERLQTFPLPEGLMSSETNTMYFGESRGHLHFITYKNNGENVLHMNVFEMLSDHSGWFVKYRVELDELLGAFPGMMSPSGGYDFKVIDVVRGEEDEEEDTFVVLYAQEKIITYNVHDKSFKQIFSLRSFGKPNFHRYIESLTSF